MVTKDELTLDSEDEDSGCLDSLLSADVRDQAVALSDS